MQLNNNNNNQQQAHYHNYSHSMHLNSFYRQIKILFDRQKWLAGWINFEWIIWHGLMDSFYLNIKFFFFFCFNTIINQLKITFCSLSLSLVVVYFVFKKQTHTNNEKWANGFCFTKIFPGFSVNFSTIILVTTFLVDN